MQTIAISGAQLNALFGVALTFIVAFVGGLLRQDSFNTPKLEWLNELIFHAVLLGLALAQTALGSQWGGSSISNFLIVAGTAYGALSTKYGSGLLEKVQSATSIGKAPPAPALYPSAEEIAAVVLQQLAQAYPVQANLPVEQQPTQALQVVRASTPPLPTQGG